MSCATRAALLQQLSADVAALKQHVANLETELVVHEFLHAHPPPADAERPQMTNAELIAYYRARYAAGDTSYATL